jgi:hypothetical protein
LDDVLLLVAILGVGLLLGWGLGGALRNIGHVRLHLWWLAPAGLVLQVLPVPHGEEGTGRYLPFALLMLSYVLLIAVTLINWRVRGFPLILFGLLLNVVPIALNQGMPVSGDAVRQIGGSAASVPQERGGKHHLATAEDRLVFLGDVISVRAPFRQVVSVGDLAMWTGAAWFVTAAMLASLERPARRLDRPGRRPQPSRMWESPR